MQDGKIYFRRRQKYPSSVPLSHHCIAEAETAKIKDQGRENGEIVVCHNFIAQRLFSVYHVFPGHTGNVDIKRAVWARFASVF